MRLAELVSVLHLVVSAALFIGANFLPQGGFAGALSHGAAVTLWILNFTGMLLYHHLPVGWRFTDPGTATAMMEISILTALVLFVVV